MKLQTTEYNFSLLTPTFCGGANNQATAELRPPSIRGQVRFWHRVLFGAASCDAVWGSSAGNGSGSKVALVLDRPFEKGNQPSRLLPHCNPSSTDSQERMKAKSKRNALNPDLQFRLTLQRLVSCSNDDWERAQKAMKLWLLLGTLGLRSSRAAGSVWPQGDWVPRDGQALAATLQELGLKNWSVALVGESAGQTPVQLRETASDTIRGNKHTQIFGAIHPSRHPSPTRFKVVRLGTTHCLLATAPKSEVKGADGQRRTVLKEAKRLLSSKPNTVRWSKLSQWNHIIA